MLGLSMWLPRKPSGENGRQSKWSRGKMSYTSVIVQLWGNRKLQYVKVNLFWGNSKLQYVKINLFWGLEVTICKG